jgi:hypothetical protein
MVKENGVQQRISAMRFAAQQMIRKRYMAYCSA